jgi:RNA polymerase sigma-70 factor (ECF subfamily)
MSRTLFDTKVMPVTGKMYRYALSILNDRDTAQDVVQECLLKIWKNRKKLPEVKNIESWAMRITRNQCYDWVKVNRYTLETGLDINRDDLLRTDSSGADEKVMLNDQKMIFEKVVDALPQKQREIFHLREVEELTYQDIAEILSLSLSEVKVTLHRTRKRIRSTMDKIDNYGLAN